VISAIRPASRIRSDRVGEEGKLAVLDAEWSSSEIG